MTLSKLIRLYWGWVRAKPAREALAALGVAVGVALVFATVTANRSIGTSADSIVNGLTGSAQLQALARGSTVPEAQVRVAELPGVERTAKALQSPVAITHGNRTVPTQVIGADAGAILLNGSLANVPSSEGLIIPDALAAALGVSKGSVVMVDARGRLVPARVGEVLGQETIGALSHSLVAFGSLGYVQQLLGLPGRISTVLASAKHGQVALARTSLMQAVEPRMAVEGSRSDSAMLDQALKPQGQSTSFFALLGMLIGVLLVGTTMMLTFADRRRELGELRLQGYAPRQLAAIVLFQGAALGAISSFLGVLAGYGLARGVFRTNPDYLASAFPLGSQTDVSLPLAIGVWVGGVALTSLCVSPVLLGLHSVYPQDGAPLHTITPTTRHRLLAVAVVLLVASLLAVASIPLLSALFLAAALLLAIPAWLGFVVRVAGRLTNRKWLVAATGSVKATQVRSVALAATVAIGVFGAIVAESAHTDLLRGLEGGYARYVASADIWVTSPSDDLATNPFPARGLVAQIVEVPGVRGVRSYYGGWVDMAGRRVWVISRSNPGVIPPRQIASGNAAVAARRLGEGGWVAVSDQLARTLHVGIGGSVSIPTPAGLKGFRVAATTTNLGWSSGLIFLPIKDYAQYWGTASPTALEVDGSASSQTIAAIQRIVGPGLAVQTSSQRAATADALPRQGLALLSQIAWLLVFAVTVAVALAMSASLWQRRAEFASLRLQSSTPRQVQMILAWEAAIVMGAGAVLGALAGVCGHFAADRYLHLSTGYPVIWTLGIPMVALVVLVVGVVTAIVLAAPGYVAARSPLRLALDGR